MAELTEFVASQAPVWDDVLREMRAGRKTSHWIWWVFPQLAILGRSHRARHFGLSGLDGAAAYLAHPLLGPRLVQVSQLLLSHEDTDPATILGAVTPVPDSLSEYAFAGLLRGAKTELVRVSTIGWLRPRSVMPWDWIPSNITLSGNSLSPFRRRMICPRLPSENL